MSVPRNHAYGAAVNGKIYVIGGRTGHALILTASNTDVVEEYNPVTDMWSAPKNRMPVARSGGAPGTDGRLIYVAGGEVTTGRSSAPTTASMRTTRRPMRGSGYPQCQCRAMASRAR